MKMEFSLTTSLVALVFSLLASKRSSKTKEIICLNYSLLSAYWL